ncbi:DoxX family protein [Tautonia sp. JC769]|uniref:DoxX family protein n=1 Tax=Tautonia sp. JC769 TaxID=3232135 RepID=UPI00345A6B28
MVTRLRWMMSGLLAIAGMVHLVAPGVFKPAMPPYLPGHLTIIVVTGGLELAAAIGLWVPRLRSLTAWCLVAYFIAIVPAHVHVAWNEIEMFGIRDPRVLWGRLAFQAVFVAAAYRLTREEG